MIDKGFLYSVIAAYRAMAALEAATSARALAKEDKQYFAGARDAYYNAADTLDVILKALQ